MAKLPVRPLVDNPGLQKWIDRIHRVVEAQSTSPTTPPGRPSSVKITPGPGQNHVRFVAGLGADSHIVLASPNPTWDPTAKDNHLFPIGAASEFPHVVGRPGVPWYYWVVAVRNGLKSDPPTGPFKGITLALNTSLVPSAAPRTAPGNVVRDSTTQLPTIPLPGLTRGGRRS